jgi:1-deoxy-D-xylulose-5-phosphate reductoisomerase
MTLTASGGPFRTWSAEAIAAATPEQALAHPNYAMGAKITIDSASMMNKGLELIEASFLFGLGVDRLEVLVHPQQIVHGLVTFRDGSVSAGMAVPDMRVAAAHCLGGRWPVRRTAKPLPRSHRDRPARVRAARPRPVPGATPRHGGPGGWRRHAGRAETRRTRWQSRPFSIDVLRSPRFPTLVEAVCEQMAGASLSPPSDVTEALVVDHDARNRTRTLLSGGRFTVT